MAKKKPADKTREKKQNDNGNVGVQAIEKITAATKGSVPAQVVGVFGVIVLVIGLALIPAGQPAWVVAVVAIGALLMAAALVVGLLGTRKADEPAPVPPSPVPVTPIPEGRIRWRRMVVSQSDVDQRRYDIHDNLRSLRQRAQQEYESILKRRPEKAEINLDRVRINVFLPDAEAGERNLQVCELYIHDQLSDGMSDKREREIKFWPGQGLTGLVFVSGRAFGATWPGGEQEWRRVFVAGRPGTDEAGEEIFHLTKDQISRIDKSLRWVIGFPLLVAEQVVGVLNIDGLVEQLVDHEMGELYNHLKPEVDRFAASLKDLIKRAIEVWVRELPNSADATSS
jgi:hypothetical protein